MPSRALRIALATSTLLLVVPAVADEPKEPLPAAPPVAAPTPLPAPAAAPDRIAEALAPQSGGLTPNEVARIALRTRPSLKVKQAELKAAAARVDQALLNFVPRVSGAASYTRLSEVQNSLGTQTVFGLNTGDPANPFNPSIPTGGLVNGACPAPAPSSFSCVHVFDASGRDQGTLAVTQVPFNFPILLNAYSFTAQIAVPVSDYLLRISQGYAAASRAESAKRIELQAEGLQVAAEAKIAFLNWVRAKGAAVVAAEAVTQAEAHLVDVRRIVDAGLASRADLLRLEAQKASAEQLRTDAGALADLAEQNLRISLGLPADKPVSIGIDILHEAVTPSTATLSALEDEALARRLEIRALDETEHSLKSLVSIARANYLPRLDAFANATYANPNQRIFPQRDEFRFTWEAGVRLSWTVNDTLSAPAMVAEAKARVEQINAQKQQLLQGLRMEVAAAYAELKRAEANIEAADRGLAAAEETLRVQSELLRAGRATSVTIVDAEAEVTRARLRRVDARVGILVAKTRLEHATGRDIPAS
ncbi:MAG: TolC family protein [Polyangiaceae bacterium]|nr:TolC family protein [Polyangiaceae bacterium]